MYWTYRLEKSGRVKVASILITRLHNRTSKKPSTHAQWYLGNCNVVLWWRWGPKAWFLERKIIVVTLTNFFELINAILFGMYFIRNLVSKSLTPNNTKYQFYFARTSGLPPMPWRHEKHSLSDFECVPTRPFTRYLHFPRRLAVQYHDKWPRLSPPPTS